MGKISKRLMTVASLVSEGNILADIGTDHGYVPIYLVEQGKIPRAIAMDINAGPLACAKEHIAEHGMSDYIETRLSDGLEALLEGEAETLLLAGMGGGLAIYILEKGQAVARSACELVLQPQSELERVRGFLEQNDYVTDEEDMICEGGKFYPMMRVHYEAGSGEKKKSGYIDPHLSQRYGEKLLSQRHPVLLEYLKKECSVYQNIYENLKKQQGDEQIEKRRQEIAQILSWNKQALACYKMLRS